MKPNVISKYQSPLKTDHIIDYFKLLWKKKFFNLYHQSKQYEFYISHIEEAVTVSVTLFSIFPDKGT